VLAAIAPQANRSESPGRIGVTTKPGLAENDQEQDHVGERTVVKNHVLQVRIQVKEEINDWLISSMEIPMTSRDFFR